MFRFVLCAGLLLVHVFSQNTDDQTWETTAEDSSNFNTTEEPWSFNTTDDHTWQMNTDDETTMDQSFELTTEDLWNFNTTGDATQEWESSTTEQVTEMVSTMTSTMCPPSLTPEMLEEMTREIIDAVLRNISDQINSRLEEIEARLAESNCSKSGAIPAIQLSWQIYENLQIPLTGWLSVFDQPYSHPTRIDDLKQISGICHNEVLVGAMHDGVITLAAVGPVSVLTLNTPWNQPKQFGEVYWYSTNGKSFGFAPTSTIRQTSADTQDLDDSQRLSWLLDQNIGGYRAGVTRSLTNDALWHKIVYCN